MRSNSIKRINYQRNYILNSLKNADPNDLIMYSDNDEIPNLENINLRSFREKIIVFKQKIFYYKFNLQHSSIEWFGTKACKKNKLKSFNWLRNIKNKKYPFWRLDAIFSENKMIDLQTIENGGWHFSKIKNEKDIFYTLSNYGEHNEFELSGLTESKIKNLIENNQLYFNHSGDKKSQGKYSAKIKLDKKSIDVLPDYLIQNYTKYKDWILQ